MENKLIKSDSFEIYEKGNDLIEHNDFFKDLVEIMENEKFSKFFAGRSGWNKENNQQLGKQSDYNRQPYNWRW